MTKHTTAILTSPTPHQQTMQCASKLMEQIGMPETKINLLTVARAIISRAKTDGQSITAAYEFLLARAKGAMDRREIVDRFWFEDRRYESDTK